MSVTINGTSGIDAAQSLKLNGATSGTVTIQAPAIAGTTVLTMPGTTGTIALTSGNLGTPTALTATNITGTANSLNAGLGVNQTWQDVTTSRAFGGSGYTNTTGKPIMVYIYTSGSGVNTITIGGVLIGSFQANASAVNGNASFIVPPGATYVVSTGATLARWSELR